MKILYIHQYFRLPTETGGHRSYYIAKALQEAGFEVEIITAKNENNIKNNKTEVNKTEVNKTEKIKIEDFEGLKIHYIPVDYNQKMDFWGRTTAFRQFFWKAYKIALKIHKEQKIDLVYATSTPLTVGITAYLLKIHKNIPYIFEIRDLWPDAPIALGYLKNFIWIGGAKFLEKTLYKNAKNIIALSPKIQSEIQKKVPNKNVEMIPNMSDNDIFYLQKKLDDIIIDKPIYQPQNTQIIPKYYTIAYTGSVGMSNHIEYFLDIAEKAQTSIQKNIQKLSFWIIGEGAELDKAKQIVHNKKLWNVLFFKPKEKDILQKFLKHVDFLYVSFLKKEILQSNSPNKFFDALAMGKCTLVNTEGWLKNLVEDNNCGFYANPENPQEFLDKIIPLLSNEVMLYNAQKNAKKLAIEQFDKNILCEKIVKICNESNLKL
jgi:glycosyltransferase involved in cell wall biosynthesis